MFLTILKIEIIGKWTKMMINALRKKYEAEIEAAKTNKGITEMVFKYFMNRDNWT